MRCLAGRRLDFHQLSFLVGQHLVDLTDVLVGNSLDFVFGGCFALRRADADEVIGSLPDDYRYSDDKFINARFPDRVRYPVKSE